MPVEHTLDPLVAVSAAKRAVLEERLRGGVRVQGIAPRARGEAAPLSFAQERLWFLDRLQQGSAGYVVTACLRLGAVAPRAMERALAELVRRHEVLRTTFREVDGVPVQAVSPAAGFDLPVEDLSGLDGTARETEVRRRFAAAAAQPFDLTTGPLFRADLLRLGTDEHVLLLAMHHAVTDGWSMGILFRELRAAYDAYAAGGEPLLPPLPLQYADFAAWQREQGRGAAAERRLAYWTERLAGAPGLLELPADRPRPAVPSYRGGTVPVHVPAETAERLRARARAEGATPFMVLLAAFQLVLARWSGTDDVVVGSPVAGRTRAEVQELIGLFVNTLVLRTDLSGDPAFRDLLGRVRETVLGAYEHQDVPFERLVEELRPERTLGHAPLFQVLFQLDDDAGVPSARSAEDEEPEAEEAARFDLTLVLRAGADGIRGTLQYATDLFDRGTAERMAEHLARVLEQAAADPERPVSRMALMGPGERAAVAAWNRTEAPYKAERCIHQLFEEQARRTPGAVAVSFGDASLTFAELDARANRLAHHLVRLGVGPEVRVGVCMERGLELLPAILAVMKAGGAWVPTDPAHPGERIGYVLEDAGARVVITQARLRSRLPLPAGARVVAVDGEWPRIAAHPADAPRTTATSENLAYVIYTSGSTGRPKGVAMHHRGVVNYIEWGVRHYGAAEGNGSPVFSSMAVDLTITNLLPLFAGRPVRMLPEENAVEALAETLRARPGWGLVKITPVHLSLLTPLLSEAEARAAAHTLVIGADFLAAETTLFWQDHAPGVRLMNEYGPTETVVGCSAYTLPNGVHRSGPVPVGGPIQNLAFHVLDGALHPVPISLPGELYIGGAGVARGYLGRPALTAEKFVPDPFAAPGARMYRTGDRARWLPSGELMILGRTDHQVKIRGYRVELGEIEGVLRGLPGVRDCLLSVREDRPGDRRLVAYVVADSADPQALREMLLERLPEYMVPAAFVRLDAFPQTPTGKLDRKALPAPERDAAGAALEEPASYLEARLIQLWEELLGVDGVGPTQSFFELGGNSLLALRLFAQVRRRLDCELPVSTLFAGGTVRHMAQAIQRQGTGGEADGAVVALQPEGALAPLFLVHSADRGVMGYVSLVRHLGADQPAWGLRDMGDDMARPLARIAADHVRALRTVQPAGPYHLCGWSFGGYVAFEMALQLQAAGETVAFVGLMDTVAPALDAHRPRERDAELPVILAAEAAERMRRPFAFDADTLEGLDPDEQVRRVMAAFRAQGPTPAGFDEAALGAGCRIVRDRYASRAGYAPGRFAGTVTLFRAGTVRPEHAAWLAPYADEERRTLGWCLHADAVEVHEIPGTHATLASEPQVRVLAGRIRDGLARARETEGAG